MFGQEVLELPRHLNLFVGKDSYAFKVGLYSFESLCILVC